jgi:isocitrate dehydrogenase (NAD+)
VAGLYQGKIEFRDMIVDNCCMQLVSNPSQFDVIVTGARARAPVCPGASRLLALTRAPLAGNLYGNIISAAAAGLTGGVGLVPGFNVGRSVRIYEQGSRHTGADIAGLNKANPAGFLFASCMMLRDMGLDKHAAALEQALLRVLRDADKDVLTEDLGGRGSTSAFTQAVVGRLPPVSDE